MDLATATDPQAGAEADEWFADPRLFFEDVLGVQIYDKQVEMIKAVRDHKRVAVNGANNTGKDFICGRLIPWWHHTHKPAKTVVVGPSHSQINDVVFNELRSAHAAAKVPLGGELYRRARWYFNSDNYAIGLSTKDEFKLQGHHSPNLLAIVTEAHDVPQDHIEAVKRLYPNCLLLTGNPFSQAGEFYEAFHASRSLYQSIQISAYDSPNVKQGREVIPGLVSLEDVVMQLQDWGEDNPLYKGAVLGEFIGSDPRSVVGLNDVRMCKEHGATGAEDPDLDDPVELGVDVGAGGDEAVIRERRGVHIGRVWRTQTRDPNELKQVILTAITAADPDRVKIDEGGPGWGIAGDLELMAGEGNIRCEVMPINFGWRAYQPNRFPSFRDEIWWHARECCEQRLWSLVGIDDTTISQLVAPQWRPDNKNRPKVESKDQTRGRIGRSTDDADALILAFFEPPEIPVQIFL